MTDSDVKTETWKPVPGFGDYEASDRGLIRRKDTRLVLKPRPNNRGYLIIGLTADNRTRQTRTVHSVILETFEGPCPPGMEACHGPRDGSGPSVKTDNRWPENLRWDTKEANGEEWKRDNPAAARPPKVCVRCGGEFTGNGRRCHPCVVRIGVTAGIMLREGVPLERAAAQLEYPSVSGLHTLAVKYGGYGQTWSQRVRLRLAARLAGKASGGNVH